MKRPLTGWLALDKPSRRWLAERGPRWLARCGLIGGLIGVGALLLQHVQDGARPARLAYADSATCLGCHPREAERWRGSAHDQAMARPSPLSVHGDFDNVTFEDSRMFRDGDDYFIEIHSDGQVRRHRVAYTFGSEPLQQYLLEHTDGRLQASALAWNTNAQAWFRVQDAALHYTSRYQTWNTMCADCHSTNVDRGYDATLDHFATTFSDIDVGCQSCHGPGARHADDPTQAVVVRNDTEACAPCHSRRAPLTDRGILTEPLFDHYRPMTLRRGLYFADGQIQDEVFEYGSFAQSAMHDAGVRCIDCHDPHGATKPTDNATCTQCHGASPPTAKYPSLAARASNLDRPEHHHHTPGSPGAACVSCHMPERTYMKIDTRHDHRFAIPRPDLSAKLGTPDVCTSACHADQDPAWAAKTIARWFPDTERKSGFAETFQWAERGDIDVAVLQEIATSTSPAIVRATALEFLLAAPEACGRSAALLQRDDSALVRSVAVACAEVLPPAQRIALAVPGLTDPRRLVRVEAARVLAPIAASVRPADRPAFRAARRELEAMYAAQRDRPEGHFNLGWLAELEGRPADAARHYRNALNQDPDFQPAQANLHFLERDRPSGGPPSR